MPQTDHSTAKPDTPTAQPVPAWTLSGLLTANLVDTTAALAMMVQAREARLVLGPALHAFAATLRQAGLTIATTGQAALGTAEEAAFPCPRPLSRAEGQPTDLVDLRLDLVEAEPLAWLDLTGVPVAWDSRACLSGVAPLARQLVRQLVALQAGAALLAPPTLALLDRLREFDDAAASHLLMGFLRLTASEVPTQVEVTALRIAGLSDMPAGFRSKTDVSLNDVALSLLDDVGLGKAPLSAAPRSEVAPPLPVQPLPPAMGLMPFARLHLLERNYAVAEDDVTGLLWFRPMDGGVQADWSVLDSRTVDGWTVVATEILGQTVDIQRAFATMHVIRRRDIATEEVAEIYDLHGLIWWLRDGESGPEARMDGGPWSAYPAPADVVGKSRAVEALFHLMPNLSSLLGHKAQEWADRMAHTVQVAPVLMQAAE
ncbi:MAG TPA: hypothetical protein VIN17_10440 [Paracoccaceae bacterium]